MNAVGCSISCIPGPPAGPSYSTTRTSPACSVLLRITDTASSWDSTTLAGPEKWKFSSDTPAVLNTDPSGAMFPRSTTRPPSAVAGCSTEWMQPPTASVSSDSQRLSVEKGSIVRTPPGAAWNSSTAFSVAVPLRMSQSAMYCSSDGECTEWTSVSNRPPRYSSPRIAGMPPARCTCSM